MKPEDLLRIARDRMSEAYSADQPSRERAADDLKFIIGENQWPETIRRERELRGKPCLTFNALPQYVRQVTGQVRSINPAIKVIPGDSDATDDVAEIIAGMIRQIEYASDATSIYEGATECAAMSSAGYFRIITDYCDDVSFDQEIRIERIHNPFSVYFDPLAKEPTRKDARYVFVTEVLDRDDFEAMYPDASVSDVENNSGQNLFQWGTAKTVTVAEYFWIEHEEATLKLGDKTRKVRKPKCMWAKISGSDVLEGPTEFPSKYLPVIAITGEEIHMGESAYRSSVIRFAKDAQQLYNYTRSAGAEIVALQPKAPWLITTTQIEGLEAYWAKANDENRPYLPYNPDPEAPPPSRVQPPVSSSGLRDEMELAIEDMKRTTGIYDASLGQRSNETSGVAINARKQESQNSTSVYADNMVKAVAQCGRVIVSMIPRVYDARRIVRILGEDDQEKMVTINDMVMSLDGAQPVNDVTVGKYDVKIGVGPSYSTRQQESAEAMMQFMQALPSAGPLIGDLIAKMQDWPESERVAERLRKALPPGLAEDDDDQKDPAAMQAKQQAMMQQQQAAQAQQQAAQAQQQRAMQMEQLQFREAEAKAVQAEANAIKAQAEAEKARLELQMMGMGPAVPAGQPY